MRLWFSPLFLISTAIMVAAVVLGYVSYRSATQIAARTEREVSRGNRELGGRLVDRIEQSIIDTDRIFFRLVKLDDRKEFIELWRRIIRVSPAVDTVVVLDKDLKLVHLVSNVSRTERRWFSKVLFSKMIPEIEPANLPPDQHRHLHTTHNGKTYLLSYIRRVAAGEEYFVILSINMRHLVEDVFVEEFRAVAGSRNVAVIDENGRVLFGRPVPITDALVFDERFPTTLYKWRLQVAPREVVQLRKESKKRRVADLVLVGAAVSVILLGMLVMAVAVRKERRASALKSDFIANVTHELKTPLSLIRMFGELLALGRAEKPETTKEYAEIITRESDRLTALIDNVLDFARLEGGKAAYSFGPGDLVPLLRRAAELVSYRCQQNGIELRVDAPETLRCARVDETALTLLVLNLLDNALKYGATSGQQIRLQARREQGTIVVTVSDDGPGIGPAQQRRIFERFYRGPHASPAVRGSGIGLSLVKSIAEAHNGKIHVQSGPNGGSTFELRLPTG
ncbi:MAG: HAMP domain-containing histidine kinase [Deltaproteobacteria bacterium]|nr:HAMP domain-containing histidine kinase [Deltaproteobacteria bacterium]